MENDKHAVLHRLNILGRQIMQLRETVTQVRAYDELLAMKIEVHAIGDKINTQWREENGQ
jgi:hypothetical protein